MDYDKLINDNGMYLYRDDDFNTISVSMAFDANIGNRENAIYDLICDYLFKANQVYDRDGVSKKYKEMYGVGLDACTSIIGGKRLFYLNMDMVSPTVVGDDYSKDCFKFARDMFLRPDFTKQDVLDTVKKERLSLLKAALSSPSKVARDLYNGKVFNDPNMEYEYSVDMNYVEDLINSITLDEMKELYEKTISDEHFFRGIVFGNTNIQEFKNFRECFPFKSKIADLDYTSTRKPTEGVMVFPSEETKQSTVYITYSMDKIDRGMNKILRDILNGSSDLCMDVLRDKHGLVYGSSVILSPYSNLFTVKASTKKENIDELIEATDEMVSIIQDPEKVKPLLERAKESIKMEDAVLSEDRYSLLYEISSHIRNMYPGFNYNEFIQNLDEIKPEDVTQATKTLKKKNVFMLRGDAK